MRIAGLAAVALLSAFAGMPQGKTFPVTRRKEYGQPEPFVYPTQAEIAANRAAVVAEAEEMAHRENWNRELERMAGELAALVAARPFSVAEIRAHLEAEEATLARWQAMKDAAK